MSERKLVSKVPDRIYLQWFGTDDDEPDESAAIDEGDVTWCSDKINDSDIEYVRVRCKRKSARKARRS